MVQVGLNFENLAIPGLSDFVGIRQEGFWRVFEATNDEDNSLVAVWVGENPTKRRHHQQYEQAIEALEHHSLSERIVRPLSAGRSASGMSHIVATPQISETLLEDIAADDGQMWTAHVDTVRSIAQLLIPAHEQNLVHGHVTPSTILVTHGELPMLSQFGLTLLDNRATFEATPADQHVTIAFRAPECLTSDETTPRTDVYGLGISLWTALNGYAPFYQPDGETAELIQRIQFEVHQPVTDRVPSDVRSVIERAMSKDPQDRQANAGEFVAELDTAVTASAILSNQPAFIPAVYESGSQLRIGTISKVVAGALVLLSVVAYAAVANPGGSKDVEREIQILGTTTISEPTTEQQQPLAPTTERPSTTRESTTPSSQSTIELASTTSPTSGVTPTTRRTTTTRRPTTTGSTTTTATITTTTVTITTSTSPSITIEPGPTTTTVPTTAKPTTTAPTTTATTAAPTTLTPTTTPTTLARFTFTLPTFPQLPDFFGPRG